MNTADLFKYATLQMAAEARYIGASTAIAPDTLTQGNERASKFTPTGASEFAKGGWSVVSQSGDMGSGFSGTLFTNGAESVLSFRSTEFADDTARDNESTNSLELFEFGWAFGQVSDMRSWFERINALIDKPLTVTGYSLGGHLATAFRELYPGRAERVITFNGAGVGSVPDSSALANLVTRLQSLRLVGSTPVPSLRPMNTRLRRARHPHRAPGRRRH